ncbi:glycine cleavage system protein GcvH [Picrophilus oshimae]|uniref:Probable glycine cleavage system H protein n=2 Tax=Picrophilus torridus (strain ATCC 700027 / DSM 9790 / JCM 10055 / NBRC 100828 / KAW 2/3) TaxID=1122961 RepID=GCSH_PICTO|nr:glycine cleavage system protein GcvH [Picrophilus oshimae]Q6L1E3.1 RecName: Full=Probable glycine cleavage system H protein [Picrophilus oshimae DSM 9789]AAT43209.1 glycine cleavage system H protein [Picrophilus oshimae DSM 9789]SMD30486.1 glycine cleavage system H protein [Picrophilus oshimae DSM 9789]
MSRVPDNLYYTKSHEWFLIENGVATVGITDYAQHQLTDIVYVDFPKNGEHKNKGETLLTIESVKSAEDVYSPVTGEIIEINRDLESKPELINEDPYKNWLVKIRLSNDNFDGMSGEEYKKYIGE